MNEQAHEARMAALMRLTRAKDRYTRISVEFLMGRTLSLAEVKSALDEVDAARAELAMLNHPTENA
jgi:hypothetical protein